MIISQALNWYINQKLYKFDGRDPLNHPVCSFLRSHPKNAQDIILD